jgi:ankyrin repeat protein
MNFEEKIINFLDLEKNTLLHLATAKNDIPLVKELIEKGADIDAINNKGDSILTLCLNHKDKTLISEYFPTLNFKEETKNTLIKYLNTTNVMLLEPFNLDTKKVMYKLDVLAQKETELHRAVETYSVSLIEKLLSEGADPNALYFKRTPLHHVYNYSNQKAIKHEELIKILKLFREYKHDESIKCNDLNLAEYLINHNSKSTGKLVAYLLEENYELDLTKKSNSSIVYNKKLSEKIIEKYFLNKINEQNFNKIDLNLYNRDTLDISLKVLEKAQKENWALSFNQNKESVCKSNEDFYFKLLSTSRHMPENFKHRMEEVLNHFLNQVDLNKKIPHTLGFGGKTFHSSLGTMLFNDTSIKLKLPLEKIDYQIDVEYEADHPNIACKLIDVAFRSRLDTLTKYLPYFDFFKQNDKKDTLMHQVLSDIMKIDFTRKSIDYKKLLKENLSLLLNQLTDEGKIDLTLKNQEGITVVDMLKHTKLSFTPEYIEKLAFSSVLQPIDSLNEKKKFKI